MAKEELKFPWKTIALLIAAVVVTLCITAGVTIYQVMAIGKVPCIQNEKK